MVFEFLHTLRQRTYHKDSYMAQRRGETLGQEGRYRRTDSPPTSAKKASPEATVAAVAAVAVNNLTFSPLGGGGGEGELEDPLQHQLISSPTSPPDAAHLSLGATAWETSVAHKDLVGSTSTVVFTSDALKKLRRGAATSVSGGKRVPPEVAPKPKNHRLLQQFSSSMDVNQHQPVSIAASASFYGQGSSSAAPMQAKQMQSAKSTPALNNLVPLISVESQDNLHDVDHPHHHRHRIHHHHSSSSSSSSSSTSGSGHLNGGSNNCGRWKNSLDSLDTVSTVSSSPRYNSSQFPNQHSVVNNNCNNPEERNDNWQPPDEEDEDEDVITANVATTVTSAAPACTPNGESVKSPVADNVRNRNQTALPMAASVPNNSSNSNGNNHCHSNSDSGLSSLSGGGGGGRTSTMSPVSTMSTVSSVSSGCSSSTSSSSSSSGGGGGSSRASLRSSSIVSQCTLPGEVSPPPVPVLPVLPVLPAQTVPPPPPPQKPVSVKLSPSVVSSIGSVGSVGSDDSGTGTLRKQARRKFQEEIDCEELSKEVVRRLPKQQADSSRLSTLLVPSPQQKTLADYVDGVLELDLEDGRGQPQRKVSRKNLSPNLLRRKIEELKESEQRLPPDLRPKNETTLAVVTNPVTGSDAPPPLPPPMKFSQRHLMAETDLASSPSSSSLPGTTTATTTTLTTHVRTSGEELHKKKEELIGRISQKLDVLRAEQLSLKEEMALNEELGAEVAAKVEQLAKANERLKFKLHVEEIEKITSLLLGLSGRLARTENSLGDGQFSQEEKQQLESKRAKLSEQLDEAKRLKENIDRRSQTVSNFLHNYLNDEQYADYDHFVKMKAKLIMDSREIGDKIKLGEEQIRALRDSIYLEAQHSSPNSSREHRRS